MRRSCSAASLPSAYWFVSGTGDIGVNVTSRLPQSSSVAAGWNRPKAVLRPRELTALKRTFRDPKVPGLPTRKAWATMPRKGRGHQKWPKATATRGRAVVRPPSSLATRRKLYLQGRQSYNQGDTAGYQRAVTAFRASTALDPRYGAAYADLALAQFWLTDDSISGDLAADVAGFDSALAAAEKAVALAPGLAAGYSARGFLRSATRFDFAGAQADLGKALERLAPVMPMFCIDLPSCSPCLASSPWPLPERSRLSRSIHCRQRSACALHSSSLPISSWHRPGRCMRRRLL